MKRQDKKRYFLPDILKGYPYDDWFEEYQKLGGKKNRIEYDKLVDLFHLETYDIFIHGDPKRQPTREEALLAFKTRAKITYKEMDLVYHSIDEVTSYT